MNNRVLIAMSGGVDSGVAAKIMRDRGFDCVGCTMNLYDNETAGLCSSRTCCSLDDVEDARSAAFGSECRIMFSTSKRIFAQR